MRHELPPRSRQVSLFPKLHSEEKGSLDDVRSELVEALADLLLEALGDDQHAEADCREPEDHA